MIVGRVYLERGESVTVLVQWGLQSRGETHGGPRNVMIRRADGSRVVRPFRGLRSTRTGDTGGGGGGDDMGVSQHRDEGEEVTTTANDTGYRVFIGDLQMALEDDRHLGFGYAESVHKEPAVREKLDRAVVRVANECGLNSEQLFQWANSKYGRWLCDEVGDDARRATAATVRLFMNADAVKALAEGR